MASELVADFLATVHASALEQPRQGRVLMRRDHIICITGEHRLDIPLARVLDVGIGSVPPELQEFFEDSLTLAYESDEARETIVLEARADPMRRFRTVLFTCLLRGREVQVRHPAKRGGRVLDTPYESGRLLVDGDGLIVQRDGTADLTIELDRVITFSRDLGRVDGRELGVISVGVLEGERVVTAMIAPDDDRVFSLLGRYLKIEYGWIHRDIIRLDLDEATLQALVALDADATDLDGMLPDVDDHATLLERLEEEDLVTAGDDDGLDLTRRGRIATTAHLESIN